MQHLKVSIFQSLFINIHSDTTNVPTNNTLTLCKREGLMARKPFSSCSTI